MSNALGASPVYEPSQRTTSRTLQDEPEEAHSVPQLSFAQLAANAHALASSVDATRPRHPAPAVSTPISLPYVLPHVGNLPVYSTSGFDILPLLARVATRPNPKISLGPVDLTCSFAVVDVRRFDHPIVYASPTFYKLTGYSEAEVLGRNCRFLQAPNGQVQKGEPRHHTQPEAVALLRRSLAADKECQVSLVNYRKNGSAFVSLVTVIPIPGGVNGSPAEAEDVVYQIGFQVDLTEQPNAILQRLKEGSYMANYNNNVVYPAPTTSKDWKVNSTSNVGISKRFRAVLVNPDFAASIPINASTTTLSLVQDEKADPYDGNRYLSVMLLETSPDFVLVLSLKGAFLYVSPSVNRVRGYEPEDLIRKSITDFCLEADKVPLIRELKEGGAPMASAAHAQGADEEKPLPLSAPPTGPRAVDLLFRMQVPDGNHVWVECSGRLFAEPGKGRKAIILSGRVRDVPHLRWQALAHAGGLARRDGGGAAREGQERECWALLSLGGSFLHASTAVRDVLGWGAAEVIGRSIADFVGGRGDGDVVRETLAKAFADASLESRTLSCVLRRKEGTEVLADLVFYHPPASVGGGAAALPRACTRPLVCQIRLADTSLQPPPAPPSMAHAHGEDVFAELDAARGSGWQYALQQLKFANQQLEKELEELEDGLQKREAQHQTQESYRRRLGAGFDYPPSGRTPWAEHLMGHQSLKRSWDGNSARYPGGT